MDEQISERIVHCEHRYKVKYINQRTGFGGGNKILIGATMFKCRQCGQISHLEASSLRFENIHNVEVVRLTDKSSIYYGEQPNRIPLFADFRFKGDK